MSDCKTYKKKKIKPLAPESTNVTEKPTEVPKQLWLTKQEKSYKPFISYYFTWTFHTFLNNQRSIHDLFVRYMNESFFNKKNPHI